MTIKWYVPTRSVVRFEMLFPASLLLAATTVLYGNMPCLFALCLSMLSLVLLYIIWPGGEVRRLMVHDLPTRPTYFKYIIPFQELCALIFLGCAALSLFGRLQAKRFGVDSSLMLLREQIYIAVWRLDLTASIAILLAHCTGYDDFCERIQRRILWTGRGFHRVGRNIITIFYGILLEPSKDLERQTEAAQETLIDLTDDCDVSALQPPLIAKSTVSCLVPAGAAKQNDGKGSQRLGIKNNEELDLQEQFRHLRRFSVSANPYPFFHQELRSFGAQLRWSDLRWRFGFQKRPLQDMLFQVQMAVQAQERYPGVGLDCANALQSFLQVAPKTFRKSRSPSLSMRTVVEKAMDYHGIHIVPSPEDFKPLNASLYIERPPIFQLPGTVQGFGVKALPDTGSSQNIIDASLLSFLCPSATPQSCNDSTDKPLVAPDGEIIPSIGKIRLRWTFKNEDTPHDLWFYVVENCFHGVIIGNRVLHETETMTTYQNRLEITKPSDPDVLTGKLLSGEQDDCYRQIVKGKINDYDVIASLDTGCETNLMSVDYAKSHSLVSDLLPISRKEVKFANGRKGTTLGQVEVSWSFSDTPTEAVKVICHVLPNCIHPVIFGDRFVLSEMPWTKHRKSLGQELTDTADTGVVGLKDGRFWRFGNHKLDPEEQKIHDEKKAKKRRAEAYLQSQSNLQAHSMLPSIPPTAVLTSRIPSAYVPLCDPLQSLTDRSRSADPNSQRESTSTVLHASTNSTHSALGSSDHPVPASTVSPVSPEPHNHATSGSTDVPNTPRPPARVANTSSRA